LHTDVAIWPAQPTTEAVETQILPALRTWIVRNVVNSICGVLSIAASRTRLANRETRSVLVVCGISSKLV
jgi:hypothetical protein